MRIPIDRSSPIPLYLQVQDFLRAEIQSGALPPGARLPATRDLASTLGISRLTATDAYAGLESEGLVISRLGSGTFVEQEPWITSPERSGSEKGWPRWQQELIRSAAHPAESELDRLVRTLTQPGTISFAAGMGDSALFPVDDFRRALGQVLRQEGRDALGYGHRAGYEPLRTTIARILASQGIDAHPGQIIITSGSQQGLALVARLLLRPGDAVLVESPTYSGALGIFRSLDVRIETVAVDAEGMQVASLETILQNTHPKLIYTMPTYQNPTGTCLALSRRRQLVALADRYDVPILEDEFVGDLSYDGHPPPPLAALASPGGVIYMGTFSKMLMPGLRIGYLLAAGPVYDHLLACKRLDDLASSSVTQRALDAFITVGRYHNHLRRACRFYRQRRDAMVDALRRHMPPGVRWNVPAGGLFLWLELPDPIDGGDLIRTAAEAGVLFAPGAPFFADGSDDRYMRLNFAELAPEMIEEGIRRLAGVVARYRSGGG